MEKNLVLVIIDPQNDFIDGTLKVHGADGDMNKLSLFIDANHKTISSIYLTLDTHVRLSIFFPGFWRSTVNGKEPPPFTIIKDGDVPDVWTPININDVFHCASYLENCTGKSLTIWPYHCLIGHQGHNVHTPLLNALQRWEEESGKQVEYVIKGLSQYTEQYSAFKADVIIEDDPSTHLNVHLMNTLLSHKTVVFAGEAKSHCVNMSVRDLVKYAGSGERIRVLTDACSNVAGFDDVGILFEYEMRKRGVKFVSTFEKTQI